MHVQRFLASAWASVHGPSDPRRLLLSVLEARFAGLMLAPGPRALDAAQLAAAAADLPFRFAGVRANDPLREISATYNISRRIMQRMGASSGSISLAGREYLLPTWPSECMFHR